MSQISLPSAINYNSPQPSLPDGAKKLEVVTNPVNLQTGSAGSIVQFDLLNQGFLVPDSMYVSYTYTSTNAVGAQLIGVPAVTCFSRMDEIIGSQTVNSISQYNQVYTMLSNLTMSVSEKFGSANALGYLDNLTTTSTMEQMDGRTLIVNESANSFSFPVLGGVLSNAEKAIPLFAMPQVRLQFQVETLANMVTNAAAMTGFTLSNIELHYSIMDFGAATENMIKDMGKLYIKSQSFSNTSQSLASGSSGSLNLIFNQRFNSIKSLFALFSGTNAATSLNLWGDSTALSAASTYQFQLGGVNYPQRVLSTSVNKSAIYTELKNAIGSIFDRTNSVSISPVEWLRVLGDTTTNIAPGKFIVGTNTEIVRSPESLLTGISSQNTPISLLLSTTATSEACNCNLIINFDALLEIDTTNRQVSLKTY